MFAAPSIRISLVAPRPPLMRKLFVVDWLAVLSPASRPVLTPGTVWSRRYGLRTLSGIEVMNLFSTTAPRSARLLVIKGATSVIVIVSRTSPGWSWKLIVRDCPISSRTPSTRDSLNPVPVAMTSYAPGGTGGNTK